MKLAIIGTGIIGSAIAEALLKAGNEVFVYNRTQSKTEPLVELGAKCSATAKEAIENAEAIIVAVYGGDVLREVILNEDVRSSINNKKILTVATSESDEIREISAEVAKLGGSFSELAIMSTNVDVLSKNAYALLGCESPLEPFWKEVMGVIGNIVYVGTVGKPSTAVIPSIMGAGMMGAYMAYAVAFAIKMDIPQEVIVNDFSTIMPGGEEVISAMFARDYSQGFATVEGYRDTFDIARKAMKTAGLPTEIFEVIISLYDKASELGFKDKAESALIEGILIN